MAQEPDLRLPRATPESQGIASSAVIAFVTAADEQVNSMHSMMVLRHGKVVAEAWWSPESADKPHVLWSLSKSFTSTAVGLAVAEGKLTIDDKVASFFPDRVPADAPEYLRAMRVCDLLTMSTGHEKEPAFWDNGPSIAGFLQHPVTKQPGTHFVYNTPATYMQSAIVQKVTGQNVRDYLVPRLFAPLGIPTPEWDMSAEGIALGGYGLYLRTEDIAKFGQLYLQKGEWNGKQLIPAEWVTQATSKQVSNGSDPERDWTQGYGFQFWRCRHNAYRGDGRAGQFCVVLPDQDAVVVMTANSDDLQRQLSLVWQYLLPAFQPSALPADQAQQTKLQELTATLKAKR